MIFYFTSKNINFILFLKVINKLILKIFDKFLFKKILLEEIANFISNRILIRQ